MRTLGWAGVDRVISLDPGRSAEGYCNVPLSLDVFDTHFPRLPLLPGMLLLDAMLELGRRCAEAAVPGVWTPVESRQLRFRHMVGPGDQVRVEIEVEALEAEAGRLSFRASARVGSQVVASARRLELVRSSEVSPAEA